MACFHIHCFYKHYWYTTWSIFIIVLNGHFLSSSWIINEVFVNTLCWRCILTCQCLRVLFQVYRANFWVTTWPILWQILFLGVWGTMGKDPHGENVHHFQNFYHHFLSTLGHALTESGVKTSGAWMIYGTYPSVRIKYGFY